MLNKIESIDFLVLLDALYVAKNDSNVKGIIVKLGENLNLLRIA